MDIPGIQAQHAIISGNCMRTHGELGAFDEAAKILRKEYKAIIDGWGKQAKDLTFHLVLTMERAGGKKDES